MKIINSRDSNFYQDSVLTIYFGDARDNLHQDYYLNLPNQPITELHPFTTIAKQLAFNDLVFLKQIHSTDGAHITQSIPSFKKEGDYLFTQQPIALGVMTADCLPIVIYDQAHHAVAAVHAGWRGSVQQIVLNTIKSMNKNYTSQIPDLKIFFGPAVRVCCYQVSDDFYKNLEQFPYGHHALRREKDCSYFDVPLFNRLQLEDAGVLAEVIDESYLLCTMCNHRFFSHRRQGQKAGRQMTVAVLR